MPNPEIAKIFREMAGLLEVKGEKNRFRINSYLKAAAALEKSNQDIGLIYKEKGLKGVRETLNVGEKMAKKIEEYVKQRKVKDYEDLEKDTAIQQIIAYYFETKGLSLNELKQNAKKKKIVYSRFTKPAKQLLDLAGSLQVAKEAIGKVAEWANSRGLDYAIETVFKKWLELGRLKPKEVVKKPFYRGDPMVWSEARKKWYVISPAGEWLEFADKEKEIEWKIIK
ncbi:MAG: hypothetical protein HY443_01490 [Candidatus Nealsonbacteria bacterium]|nr:hypothetical protein [Candidatus Nealsonbacteria bacterium]